MKRGFILRPLLDEDREPTTRSALIQAERGGLSEFEADREWRITIDPELVSTVVRLQAGAK